MNFRNSKKEPSNYRSSQGKELHDLLDNELSKEERFYVENAQARPVVEDSENDPAHIEAEVRRREWQRINQNFKPKAPLYGVASKEQQLAKDTEKENSGTPAPRDQVRKSYQNDPRYRDFYEKRRQTQGRPATDYDEDIEALSIDELDKMERKQPTQSQIQNQKPQFQPPPQPVPQPEKVAPVPEDRGDPELVPGSIFKFDDDSVGVYRDAVSGKDYALFFFLEPDGTVSPQGIFLEQYGRQKIGLLKDPYFEKLRVEKRWDRDVVVFHLDKLEYASYIRNVTCHNPQQRTAGQPHTPAPTTEYDTRAENRRRIYQEHRQSSRTPAAPPRDPLEKGRVIRVNMGAGRIWESVYWTRDEIGPIVAHNTNREWALMHFDVKRFKDSLEYGGVLTEEELQEIEDSLARQR